MATDRHRLRQFIETESSGLLGTLRVYLYRAGLATSGTALDAAASDLLNDVVVEALEHEDRFRPGGQPRAWLLGIAANLVKRRQVERSRRDRREPLARDLLNDPDSLSDDELFDRLAGIDSPENPEAATTAADLLAALSPDDQRVLRLAVLAGMDGDSLAGELGISPGAARVRLHRAINRLRAVYRAGEEQG